ncbi:MAG: BCCT family transporter, partial [Desulfobacterales bacterium]|nr:BCCT family transporter [Desulfobacterales bacterium]
MIAFENKAEEAGHCRGAQTINSVLALVSGVSLLLILSYAGLDPVGMKKSMEMIQSNISRYFGWWYILLDFIFISPVFIIPFTRWGRLKLGRAEDTPDYTRFEWLAMLLCCTFAIGIIIWAVAEPLFHLMQPPKGAAPGSVEALKDAFQITILHMGVGGFGLFAVAGACIALPAYRYGLPICFSTAFYGLL